MRKLRKCASAHFNTGVSKCPPDFGKMKGAILVKPGTKLPVDLTAEKLETLVHADRASRVYGIVMFVEYAKNGGEVQTSANGYGPEEVTGVSARKDTYTLNKFNPGLQAALMRCKNQEWDVYFFDENGMIYGIEDDTDILAGFPMAAVYADSTPHPTSSAKSAMTVTFAHKDAELSIRDFNYEQLDFNPAKMASAGNLVLGLTQVKFGKATGGKYKLYEVMGGNDVTSIYGPLIATAGADVINGSTTAVTYDEATDSLTIAASDGTDITLKSPSVLYEKDIKGIEQAAA